MFHKIMHPNHCAIIFCVLNEISWSNRFIVIKACCFATSSRQGWQINQKLGIFVLIETEVVFSLTHEDSEKTNCRC